MSRAYPPPVEYKGTLTEWQLLSSSQRYQIRHRDKVMAYRKKISAVTVARAIVWQANNKEKVRASKQKYKQRRAAKYAETSKAYYIRNRDRIREVGNVYRTNNKEKHAARRAEIKDAYSDEKIDSIAQGKKDSRAKIQRIFYEMFDEVY
jgi:hypothetical protein